MIRNYMHTSESVTEGHPDKLCDQISDAVIDHFLSQDPYSRVRVECAVSKAIVFIAARFASEANVDFTRIARKMIQRIGYDHPDFNPKSCSILTSPQVIAIDPADQFDEMRMSDSEIAGVKAKNQVTVFGFACNHTSAFMPLPIVLAHGVTRRLTELRKDGTLPYLMPDGKVQVGIDFVDRKPRRVHSITMEIHIKKKSPSLDVITKELIQRAVKPTLASENMKTDRKTRILINPEGPYSGGPMNHSGLTGRKNAVDTYGEYSRHSGKALSGKDPMRIDRIGAYAARYAAKNIIAAGLADECEVVLSYATGETEPVTLLAQSFGTGRVSDDRFSKLLRESFDFRPAAVLRQFRLRRLPSASPVGFYQHVASYGHFGRSDIQLPWEETDRADALRTLAD
jgi:S-adenosylmethionine synthetase